MKHHVYLLIADTDAGNNVEIFQTREDLRRAQRSLMLDLDNNGPASVPALIAAADKKLEAGDVQAAGDAFAEACDLWREDQGFGNDWLSTDDQEIEVPDDAVRMDKPVEYSVVTDARAALAGASRQSELERALNHLKLCVARLEEYGDAEGGTALEGARQLLKQYE